MGSYQELEVEVRDVEYQSQGGKAMLARVYQPKGPGPFPLLVDVHGGAWHNGDRTNNKGIDQVIASTGVVVAALDFRQPPEAAYPASIADVNLGVRWAKAHAKDFNGSGSVGAFGNSSGGHQVVLVGLRPHDPRYAELPLADHPELDANLDYVIAAWPVIDPLYRFRYAKEKGRQTLIDAHLEYWGTEEAMQEGSCVAAAEEDEQLAMPPILMMLKVGDQNHPQAMQDAFVAAYRKRGGPVEVEMFDGLPEYGVVPTPDQPETMRALDAITTFIAKHSG